MSVDRQTAVRSAPQETRRPSVADDTALFMQALARQQLSSALRTPDDVPPPGLVYSVGCHDGPKMARALGFHRDQLAEMYRGETGDREWAAGPFRGDPHCVLIPVPANTDLALLEGLLVDLAMTYSFDLRPPFGVVGNGAS